MLSAGLLFASFWIVSLFACLLDIFFALVLSRSLAWRALLLGVMRSRDMKKKTNPLPQVEDFMLKTLQA